MKQTYEMRFGNRKSSVASRSARFSTFILFVLIFSFAFGSVHAHAEPLVFADWSWDSAIFHNRVAGFIIENGFGHEVDYLFADSVPGMFGMRRGEIHISMEIWIDNLQDVWYDAVDEGSVIDLGHNFANAPRGWWVPTYVIEGDPERGIEPMAPGLRSVHDLPKYWEVFRDPENPRKGRFYNGPTGWLSTEQNSIRLTTYGLDDYYTSFHPGSQAALDSSIVRAYERGEAWVGSYWEPTAIMGTYDMTLLEEDPHTAECWDAPDSDFGCSPPPVTAEVAVHHSLVERVPEVVEFLRNYRTEPEHSSEALSYMEATGSNAEATALWFLQEYEELWTQWVDEDVAAKVKATL